MQGNNQIIATLNRLLASEQAAVIQYGHHESIAQNLNLKRLAEYIAARKGSELDHIDELREHILLLSGVPVTDVADVSVSESLDGGLQEDDAAEARAIADYQRAIAQAVSIGDEATANLLRHILAEEVEHKNATEAQLAQIELVGMPNWVAAQMVG